MRNDFHVEIDGLIDSMVSMADTSIDMLTRAVHTLETEDQEEADRVIRTDDVVDERYADVHTRAIRLMALQAPVASDLRLISSTLTVNIHLERMADYATNVAKMGKLSVPYAQDPELTRQLREMATIATRVARKSVTAYAHRDVEAAWGLPELDDGVDRLNIGMFHRLVRLAGQDFSHLEWATRMILVARQIERFGDHAVDIGEATIFAVTGEMVELSSNAPTREGDSLARVAP